MIVFMVFQSTLSFLILFADYLILPHISFFHLLPRSAENLEWRSDIRPKRFV